MIKYLYLLIIAFILVFLDLTALAVFLPAQMINILLVMLVFITFIWGFNYGFFFSVAIGFFLGLFTYLPFFTYILIYLMITLIIDYLHKQIFINFTFFTNLFLMIIATFLYTIFWILSNLCFYMLGFSRIYISLDKFFLYEFFWQIILNSILISIMFIFARAIFKKLNLAFLIQR